MSIEQPKQYIERGEFEERLDKLDAKVDRGFASADAKMARGFEEVARRFDTLGENLAKKEEQKRPGLWVVLGIVLSAIGAVGIPSLLGAFAIVVTMNDTRALQELWKNHESFSSKKADEFETGIGVVSSQIQSVEQMLRDAEQQNVWQADIASVESDYNDRIRRMYCVTCDRENKDSRLWIDAKGYFPLSRIGTASVPDSRK